MRLRGHFQCIIHLNLAATAGKPKFSLSFCGTEFENGQVVEVVTHCANGLEFLGLNQCFSLLRYMVIEKTETLPIQSCLMPAHSEINKINLNSAAWDDNRPKCALSGTKKYEMF